jgi:FtsP/CotA-like multicopper oxidase with cupredoxin domain
VETFTGSDADKAKLNFDNPPRRDVAMLPANGWMVIAFQADNPGAWLLHCHVRILPLLVNLSLG